MKWIGLTGSIGAGKSTVAMLLRKSGFIVIDADAMIHEELKSGTSIFLILLKRFGTNILNSSGEINRRELGRLVFADNSLKVWLESLLHPLVQSKVQELRKKLESEGHSLAFYEVPILFEKGLESQFNKTVVVWVSEGVQKERLIARNAWSEEEILQRINSQWPVKDKIKKADYQINNDGSIETLEVNVAELIRKLNS